MGWIDDEWVTCHDSREIIGSRTPSAEPTSEREPIQHRERENHQKCVKHWAVLRLAAETPLDHGTLCGLALIIRSCLLQEIEYSCIDDPMLAEAHVVTAAWHEFAVEIRNEPTCAS